MLDMALNSVRFFRNESCGKCVPCRLGSRKMVDMAESLLQHDSSQVDPAELENTVRVLSRIMETTSICGLGQVASNPLKSYLRYFWRQQLSIQHGQ